MKKISGFIVVALLIQIVLISSCKEKENEIPSIEITAPDDGTVFMRGDQVTVKAHAEDSDGSIQEVRFYIEYIIIETVSAPPYEYFWQIPDSVIGDIDVRAVAIDNVGGANSHSITVVVDAPGGFNPDLSYGTMSDIDGNSYMTIEIADQKWMAENLKVTHNADGSPIPLVADEDQWSMLGESGRAYCWYDNMSEYGDTAGALYSWSGAMNGATGPDELTGLAQGVCPDGWHLPSDEEWKQLELSLGMSQEMADKTEWRGSYEGGKLKELGFSHWENPNSGGTNFSGFTALPGGYRSNSGTFYGFRQYAAFWTASEKTGSTNIWFRALNYEKSHVYRYWIQGNRGASVRCVEDQ